MFPAEATPERIGAYRIVRRLPSHGGPEVYLGREEGPRGFSRAVTLKLVPDDTAGDAKLADELSREALVCERLNHPAIVRMHDFFEHAGKLVLVSEYVEGTTLARLLAHLRRRKERLADDAVFYIASRVLGALAHAHAMADDDGTRTPVLHRDLCPRNVLIGRDATVKLTGFGLAKILGRTPDTAMGLVKGTPGYMAPEQARGERITERADVYATGILLWELLTGRAAFGGSREVDLLRMVAPTKLEGIESVRADVPREIAAAIDAALEPSADKRTITSADLERWITKLASVERGRKALRDKMQALRGAAPPRESLPDAVPTARASRLPHHVSPRFPGVGTRASGRPSQAWRKAPHQHIPAAPRASQRPPAGPSNSSRPPAVSSSSSRPSPRASSPPPRPSPKQTLLGIAPAVELAPAIAPPAAVEARNVVASPRAESLESGARMPSVADVAPPAATPSTGLPPARAAFTSDVPLAELEPKLRVDRRTVLLAATASLGAVAALAIGIASVRALVSHAPATPEPRPVASEIVPAATVVPPPTAASAALPTEPAPTAAPAVADELPAGFGRLTIGGPLSGSVYVNGVAFGATGAPAAVPCGRKFVRVGIPGENGLPPHWLARGQTVIIPCAGSIEIVVHPSPQREPRPKNGAAPSRKGRGEIDGI